jgi:hypothetical protein
MSALRGRADGSDGHHQSDVEQAEREEQHLRRRTQRVD